jgi:drug/metabolite transporter (DMT)-like permease
MESRLGTLAANLLALVLLVFGIYQLVNHRDDSLDAVLRWGMAALASAVIVAAGVFTRQRFHNVGTAMLVVGCAVAFIPTMPTLVLPVLELAVIALALRDHARLAQVV